MFLVMKVSLYVKNSESDLQLVYNTHVHNMIKISFYFLSKESLLGVK